MSAQRAKTGGTVKELMVPVHGDPPDEVSKRLQRLSRRGYITIREEPMGDNMVKVVLDKPARYGKRRGGSHVS